MVDNNVFADEKQFFFLNQDGQFWISFYPISFKVQGFIFFFLNFFFGYLLFNITL